MIRRWVLAVAAATSLLSTAPLAVGASTAEVASVDTRTTTLLVVEQALIELTNTDRASHGLPPLAYDPELLPIARTRAADQLELEHLSHYDANGLLVFVKLLDRAGLQYGLAGENLARSASNTPDVTQRIETALMKSPTHRKNILERAFSRIAIGAALDSSSGRIAFAQIFRGD
jgi:uncharacterized protein YkwD